jgi:hypothetical protein
MLTPKHMKIVDGLLWNVTKNVADEEGRVNKLKFKKFQEPAMALHHLPGQCWLCLLVMVVVMGCSVICNAIVVSGAATIIVIDDGHVVNYAGCRHWKWCWW